MDFEIRNLTTGYQSPIVNEIDLSIPEGKLTALIGPNGCGKSTLLKCMARVLPPMSGQVLLNGQSIHTTQTKLVAQQLSLLPQSPVASDGLTVRDLVKQGRYPYQSLLRRWKDEDEIAVEEALEWTNTTELADRPLSALSGGQRQRCWIAMVLAQSTPIILLDEPTTFLDLKVQVDLLELLSRLCSEQNRTLVVVLHELNLAASYADHLVMMKSGKLHAQGTPDSIFTSTNLKHVFDLDANILRDPNSDRLMCVPKSPSQGMAATQPQFAAVVNQ